ncbi:hypothetical protein BT246_48410 [Bacillus thuringiensis]|uniref:Uncharacterized protein n=1 Tax=Bacillus thuringiensis TaxID=1428 RepID=A0A9W3X2F8_BACTU|nr:hypothetical protein BT246_48410 [Bacillus thuringiensis]
MIESPTGKLKGATFKYIESELYGYSDTLREIAFLRKNLIYCSPHDDENIGGGRRNVPDRPTERIGTKLTVHKNLFKIFSIKLPHLPISNSVYYFQVFVHNSSTVYGNFPTRQRCVPQSSVLVTRQICEVQSV